MYSDIFEYYVADWMPGGNLSKRSEAVLFFYFSAAFYPSWHLMDVILMRLLESISCPIFVNSMIFFFFACLALISFKEILATEAEETQSMAYWPNEKAVSMQLGSKNRCYQM